MVKPTEKKEQNSLEPGEMTARIGLALYMEAAGLLKTIASNPEEIFTEEELVDNDPTGLKKRLLKAATDVGLLCQTEKGITASTALIGLRKEMPYMDWLFRACGTFLTHLQEFLVVPMVARKVYPRNGELVAETSVKIGNLTYYRAVKDAVMMLKPPPKKIIDIGAGTANLLCSIIETIPTARGTALDMDADACAAARVTVIRHGLTGRIQVIQQRAETAVKYRTEMAETDVVILCFLLHEILAQGQEQLTNFLQGIANILSPRGCLIVVEIAMDEKNPRFAALFAWIHDLQGQRLISDGEWRDIFKNAGLRVVRTTPAFMPGSRLYQLRRKRL